MRNLIKKVVFPFARPLSEWFSGKKRNYTYKNIKAVVLPEVFGPHFIFSTKILLDFIANKKLANQSFLELGCGSGIISTYAAVLGAKVTASDINPLAIENVQLNADKHQVILTTYISDLFDQIPNQHFNYIIINPPYYPKNALSMKEKAWYCGENFEYFHQLFSQLSAYMVKDSNVYMILSSDCDVDQIHKIAHAQHYQLAVVLKKQNLLEENYIFEIIYTEH